MLLNRDNLMTFRFVQQCAVALNKSMGMIFIGAPTQMNISSTDGEREGLPKYPKNGLARDFSYLYFHANEAAVKF